MAQELSRTQSRGLTNGEGAQPARSGRVYRPDTDIYEDSDHIVLVIDMPGVASGDVDVTLERRVLTIRGRVHASRPDTYRSIYTEYGEGDFERAFTLSEDIDEGKIEASHKDGVLTLRLPRAERARTRKIEVKAA